MIRKSRVPGWNWFLQRISGLVLVLLVTIHFLVLHYTKLIEPTPMVKTPIRSLRDRFASHPILWMFIDGTMLLLVMYHALNGVRNILYDYNPSWRSKKIITIVLWVVGAVFSAWGLYLLSKFLRMV